MPLVVVAIGVVVFVNSLIIRYPKWSIFAKIVIFEIRFVFRIFVLQLPCYSKNLISSVSLHRIVFERTKFWPFLLKSLILLAVINVPVNYISKFYLSYSFKLEQENFTTKYKCCCDTTFKYQELYKSF